MEEPDPASEDEDTEESDPASSKVSGDTVHSEVLVSAQPTRHAKKITKACVFTFKIQGVMLHIVV
jgi:hypothetical protein